MTDLTKITTIWALLDEQTQQALKECGGPWQVYNLASGWRDTEAPLWNDANVYRKKPEPETYVFWVNIWKFEDGEIWESTHDTQDEAEYYVTSMSGKYRPSSKCIATARRVEINLEDET